MIVFNYIGLLSLGPFGQMGPFGTRFEIYRGNVVSAIIMDARVATIGISVTIKRLKRDVGSNREERA